MKASSNPVEIASVLAVAAFGIAVLVSVRFNPNAPQAVAPRVETVAKQEKPSAVEPIKELAVQPAAPVEKEGKLDAPVAPATPKPPEVKEEVQATAKPATPEVATPAGKTVSAHEVRGRITLSGKPPAESAIDFPAACHADHDTPAMTQKYVVDATGGLANTFVYIKEGFAGKAFPKPAPVVLDQKGCLYRPYVMGIQVGQTLTIQNSDDTLHNVHVLGVKNTGVIGGTDNLGQATKGAKNDAAFKAPEIFVKFKCDVHPWMFAYVGVVNNPYFAVTGPDGAFSLTGLPDGDYTIAAAHPRAGEQVMKISLKGSQGSQADFVFAPK